MNCYKKLWMLVIILTLGLNSLPLTVSAQDETLVFTPQWTAQCQGAYRAPLIHTARHEPFA